MNIIQEQTLIQVFFQENDWDQRAKRTARSPERVIGNVNFSDLRRHPPPPPDGTTRYGPPPNDRAERDRWNPQSYPRYPDYYEAYYPGTYHQDYRRPYEDNYREQYQSQPYPYRPPYDESYSRYNTEERYAPRYMTRRDPYPPRPRYEDEDYDYYRRESFSEYRDHPSKRRRARNSTYPRDPSPSPERPKRQNYKHKSYREDRDSESDDYATGANSDVESVQSVKEITDKTRLLSTHYPSDEETDEPRLNKKQWTEQEKKAYFDRLDLVTTILDGEMDMPPTVKQPTTSGARGPVTITTKPETLPHAPFVLKKFNDHLERAEQILAKVDVVNKQQEPKEGEQNKKTQVEQSKKVQLGLALRPFNPSWLYKVHKEPYPQAVLPDAAIRSLTNGEAPLEEYLITRAQIHKIQRVTTLQLNAASHIDWLLIGIHKLLAELKNECEENDPRLTALEDLRYATAYANEYTTDQAIFIHAGLTTLMREHYLEQMQGLSTEEYNELLTQPYQSISAFNDELANIITAREHRDRSAALHKLAVQGTNQPHVTQTPMQPKSDLLQRLNAIKQRKVNSSKVKKQRNQGQFDSKPKKTKSKQKDGKWPKGSQNKSGFPFNSTKFHKRKNKHNTGYTPKSGSGRGRDYN